MGTKNKKIIAVIAVALIVAMAALIIRNRKDEPGASLQIISPRIGDITTYITVTGSVLPNNRLEIKPPVNGRIERILVGEGQKVRKGQVLAYMSSTERSALIDAAKIDGAAAFAYWEKVYQPIALVTPISGEVIVRDVEPGQTVTAATTILVISDRLLVKAEVDETDIGRVRIGLDADISLEAHPDVQVKGRVTHISFESKTVNNVTMYEVEVQPVSIPGLFRSGMTANIKIIDQTKKNVILVPLKAVTIEGSNYFVKVEGDKKNDYRLKPITAGITDDVYLEVVSGISEKERIVISQPNKIASRKSNKSTNPFLPSPPKK